MQVFMGSAKWLQVYFCEERVICTLGKTFEKKKKNEILETYSTASKKHRRKIAFSRKSYVSNLLCHFSFVIVCPVCICIPAARKFLFQISLMQSNYDTLAHILQLVSSFFGLR